MKTPLQDVEHAYRLLVEEAHEYAIVILDESGVIVTWNLGAERLFEYTESQAVGEHARLIFTPEDRARKQPELELQRAHDTGRAEDRRWHQRKNGSRFFADGVTTSLFDDSGTRVVGYSKIARDITAHHVAEMRLRAEKEYAESILATIREPLLVLDGDFRIITANRAFLSTFRLSADATVGQLLFELGRGEWNIATLAAALHRLREHDEVVEDAQIEQEFSRGLGQRVLRFNARKIDRGDDTGRMLLVLDDITTRRASELELEHANRRAVDELQQLNRAKDLFLARLSHELRTPLTVISAWTQMLRMAEEPEPEALEVIASATSSLTRLVDDLLDVSRIAAGKLRLESAPVDLNDVVRRALTSSRVAEEQSAVAIAVDLPDAPVEIEGDAVRLQQVIWNLLNNAVKFTPAGGEVRLTISRNLADALLLVDDTGSGIPSDLLDSIFDRFTQAESAHHGGLGLGLSIVREIVELHGGSITAENRGEGVGARFVVRLPLLTRD